MCMKHIKDTRHLLKKLNKNIQDKHNELEELDFRQNAKKIFRYTEKYLEKNTGIVQNNQKRLLKIVQK